MTLALENLTKAVGGETWIHPTDLVLEPGSFNVLLGPTRAGKTTLMRLMAGLDRPSGGRILVDGKDVTRLGVRQRNVAMVYQQFVNYPSFTVYDNIASSLRLAKVGRDEIDRRVRETATLLGLESMLDRLPVQLSGGQQQRVAMGRALVKDASLLLLDEPLVNLDYKLREDLRAEMKRLFADRPGIVVYATTEPQEALMLGGRTAVLHEGRVVQFGPTMEVYRRPATVDVARRFSDPPMNLLPASVVAGTGRLSDGTSVPLDGHLAALEAGSYTLGVHATDVSLARRRTSDLEVTVSVDLAEINGSETIVHGVHEGTPIVLVEEGVHLHHLGDRLTFYVDPRRFHVFDGDGRLTVAPPRGAAAPVREAV